MESRIPLEELAKLPNFYMPTVSWQRDKLAFFWDKSGRLELYVMDLQERQPRQISHGEVPRTPRAGFVWDRDGRTIIFAKDRQGDEQHDLYQIDVETGEVRRLTQDPECQEYPVQVSPDKEWVTVLTDKFGQLNLCKVRLSQPQEYIQLTNYPNPVFGGGQWSPDGQWIAYAVNESPDLNNSDVYIIRADGREAQRVLRVKEGSQESVTDWSPDGRFLAITSDASGVERPGLLDVTSGEVRWLGQEGVNESAQSFSQNGRYLACLRNQDAQIRPVIYDLGTGEARDLELPPGVGVGSDFVNDDTGLVTLFTTATRRAELLLYDLENDTYETLLAAEYGSIDPSLFVESEHIWYPSFDDRQIPALLHTPRDIALGEKRPAIVIVHGGPTGQFFQSFDPYAQFLVDQGYVVLKPNIRGSTGYGVEFRDMNRYDWGGGDLEDVAAGAAYLKSLPFVDPNRLAVFGGSYGGYMTFMQVVKKPELWKAASAAVGITDLKQLYDDSMEHFKYYLRHQMGHPEENAQLWHDRNAVHFAERLEAKLQILHGANDPRCPVSQSRLFRDRLVQSGYRDGADFEYVEFDDQGHGSADIEHKIRWYTLLADFLAREL
jgi:dipeptidyl aminopeptidase/acylaminoacyl peptidase